MVYSGQKVEVGKATTIKHTKKLPYALYLGFFAGVIWGAMRILFYFLGFSEVKPGFLAEPFFTNNFMAGTGGWMAGWAAWILFSIVASLLYTFLLRKLKGPWYGIIYGFIWYAAIILLVAPLIGIVKPLGLVDWNTLIVEACLFALWGVFIGYSVAFEFTEERERSQNEGTFRLQ